jgi:hypothetical protein
MCKSKSLISNNATQWRSQELSLGGAPGRIFFLISLIRENLFVSSTKQLRLGGCECPLAPPPPPLATLLTQHKAWN